MAGIETSITISLPTGVSPERYISAIQEILNNSNGLETRVNIMEVDDLVASSALHSIKELEI